MILAQEIFDESEPASTVLPLLQITFFYHMITGLDFVLYFQGLPLNNN